VSEYQNLVGLVESLKCPTCSGQGDYDDAEPGDIFFNTFRCTVCKGTGFRNGETYQATPISGNSVR
jgi:hypothetical protein